MVSRRGGRPAWLPALLLWAPLLLLGLYLLAGVELQSTDVGRGEHSVQVSVEAPAGWFDPVARGVAGVVVLVLALVAYGLYQWRPAPNRALVVTHFGLHGLASLVLLAFAVLGTWDLSGHVVDGGPDGLVWRFIASERSGALNVGTYVAGYAAALVLFVLSVGSRRHVLPRSAGQVAPAPAVAAASAPGEGSSSDDSERTSALATA